MFSRTFYTALGAQRCAAFERGAGDLKKDTQIFKELVHTVKCEYDQAYSSDIFYLFSCRKWWGKAHIGRSVYRRCESSWTKIMNI